MSLEQSATPRERTGAHGGAWEQVLGAFPEAVLVVDQVERIVFANARADALFGYTPGELRGQPLVWLIPERPASAGGSGRGKRKDGQAFPLELMQSPFDTTDGQFMCAVVRDVTTREAERRQAEDVLHPAQARQQHLNRITMDREARILELKREVNTLCRQFGVPPRYSVEPPESPALPSGR